MEESLFWRWAEEVRPQLVSFASRRLGEDGEDVVSELLVDYALPRCGRFMEGDGVRGFRSWLFAFLRIRIAYHARRRQRQAESEVPLASLGESGWMALELDRDACYLEYAELMSEFRARMRHAALTEFQFLCLLGRLHGKRHREIARIVGSTVAAVRQATYRAVLKLRSPAVTLLAGLEDEEAGEADRMILWLMAKKVSIYRRPQKKRDVKPAGVRREA